MPAFLTLHHHGRLLRVRADAPDTPNLARLLWGEGHLPPRPLCAGVGRCGQCKIHFLSPPPPPSPTERDALSPEELEAGWRLACRHRPKPGMELEVDDKPASATDAGRTAKSPPTDLPEQDQSAPDASLPVQHSMRRQGVSNAISSRTPDVSLPIPHSMRPTVRNEDQDHVRSAFGITVRGEGEGAATSRTVIPVRLAVDLGTTSLAWLAEDEDGRERASGQNLNPQMALGTDVMSRLAVADSQAGAERLRQLAGAALRDVADGLLRQGLRVTQICLAGNPAMTALALGLDTSGLRAAPYSLPKALHAKEGGRFALPGLPDLYIPPHLAPFAGGDLSAGLALLLRRPRPFLLADMGTNGEFALLRENAPPLIVSVPLGPALEGAGMRCGGLAGPGGVTAFIPSPEGLRPQTLDGSPPAHICGVGYLSLLHALLNIGILNPEGRFMDSPDLPAPWASPHLAFLRRRLTAGLRNDGGERRLLLTERLFLSAGDVENLLKVKAAFSLAVERLLAEAGMEASGLRALYLAGALGQHAPLDSLEALGFLPRNSVPARALGNTSLRGAALLLRSPEMRPDLTRALALAQILDLTSAPDFLNAFARHMRFFG